MALTLGKFVWVYFADWVAVLGGMVFTGFFEAGSSGSISAASCVMKSVISLIFECALVIQNNLRTYKWGWVHLPSPKKSIVIVSS